MSPLPMQGLTHKNRSPITCHLKCDSACALPLSHTITEPTFAEIARQQLSRRRLLGSAAVLAAGAAVPGWGPVPAAAMAPSAPGPARRRRLPFTPIAPVDSEADTLVVPEGHEWHTLLRWGDPLFDDSPPFDPEHPSGAAQARQFGYNNDYLDILSVGRRGRRGLLVCNHEYINLAIAYPPAATPEQQLEVVRASMAAHGMSVVQLRRSGRGRRWRYIRGGWRNRRITQTTPFRLTGPAAGSDLVTTAADPSGTLALGTFNNCAGGTTPWGTVLSGEENFQGYFLADPAARGAVRYGLVNRQRSSFGWEKVDPRFDARQPGYRNEPHRFGYIVELDPYDPDSLPRKHTSLGRFRHEGANIRIDARRNVAAYMGDDTQFDYVYKFVSSRRYRRGRTLRDRRSNLRLLSEGSLYVAKFEGEQREDNANIGTGRWLPLLRDGESAVPGFTAAEVAVFTRLAADAVGATPMDRPEDVEPHPRTGKVYVACTNNRSRGVDNPSTPQLDFPPVDAANPRPVNRDGHVIEIAEDQNLVTAETFAWNLILVCGDPEQAGTYFGGWEGEVSPISCPDNVAFDSVGNLWVATDGAPDSIRKNDGLFLVPVAGAERGRVQQFLSVPVDAETCGPVIRDREDMVLVAVQHPGEAGRWNAQRSYFPDYVPAGQTPGPGKWRGPRPSVVQVLRAET